MLIISKTGISEEASKICQSHTAHLKSQFFFFLNPHLRIFFSLLLEREEERKKHQCKREASKGCLWVASCICPYRGSGIDD